MSMKVYTFHFETSTPRDIKFCEPYGGGIGTSIPAFYISTGTADYKFYHYYSYSSGTYKQELWRKATTTWNLESRSASATLSTEPYTSGWDTGRNLGVAPTVTSADFYTANITANAYGTVSMAKLFYDASAQRSATATPNTGSSFIGWYLTGTSTKVTTDADFTVTGNVIALNRNPVSADIAVEARFTAVYQLTTSTNNPLFGQAYIGDEPSTDTTRWLIEGAQPNIRAVPNAGYKFSKWTLGGYDFDTIASIQITTAAYAETYVAVFIPTHYTLDVTVQNAVHGTVAVEGHLTTTGLSIAGQSVFRATATPAFGYEFLDWYIAGVAQNKPASNVFTMPDANLAIEAWFISLPTAPLTITKTRGANGDAEAADMGSVTKYHLDSVYINDFTSPVGDATLDADLYNGKSYKFVPTPVNDKHQFDGWYQTVSGVQEPIVTGDIFTVEGNDLIIVATDTDAIAVNAQFSERDYCEITPVASDSSVYEAGNAAANAGCTCVISAPPADDTESNPDRWLSGQTITVEARKASGWELRSWIVKRVSDGVTVASKSKGDAGFGQTFSFSLLTDVQVIAVSAYTLPADKMQIQALLKSGQPLTSGTVEIHPCGDNYVEMENGSTANVDDGAVCELTAIPANGYKFVGWRVATEGSEIISTLPTYSFTVTASAVYYAEFEATGFDSLVLFESGSANKTLNWAGKTYLAPIPTCMSSARVYADAYPVLVSIGMSDNPSHPANVENVITSTAPSQNPFRLPMRRPRKSFSVQFTATDTVSEVCVATSMEDLKDG